MKLVLWHYLHKISGTLKSSVLVRIDDRACNHNDGKAINSLPLSAFYNLAESFIRWDVM